jgi:hypothetical protein
MGSRRTPRSTGARSGNQMNHTRSLRALRCTRKFGGHAGAPKKAQSNRVSPVHLPPAALHPTPAGRPARARMLGCIQMAYAGTRSNRYNHPRKLAGQIPIRCFGTSTRTDRRLQTVSSQCWGCQGMGRRGRRARAERECHLHASWLDSSREPLPNRMSRYCSFQFATLAVPSESNGALALRISRWRLR